jgi:hypothetical protein
VPDPHHARRDLRDGDHDAERETDSRGLAQKDPEILAGALNSTTRPRGTHREHGEQQRLSSATRRARAR